MKETHTSANLFLEMTELLLMGLKITSLNKSFSAGNFSSNNFSLTKLKATEMEPYCFRPSCRRP